jgi:hypothetical protein
MSRIRMAVEIRNESAAPLTWVADDLESGDWTDPWQPPRSIAPGATGEFRAEGSVVAGVPSTGTEGRVHYSVGGDRNQQLYVHWNSPLVESQYGNTFHVWAPAGFEAAFGGGQGHEARLEIRVRETARRWVRGFSPSVCGFAFSNGSFSHDLPIVTVGYLWNRLLDTLGAGAAEPLGIGPVDDDWLPITHADQGVCGGMVFAAMDYAAAQQLPPAASAPPTSADDPLFQHIRDRLIDSFDITGSGYRWLAYSSPTYPNGDEGFLQVTGLARGRSWVTYRDEWPRIRDDIDRGRLSPVGLVQTDALSIGDNHQVLAYAYQQSGQSVRLWIYDPNVPGNDDVVLEFDITDTAGEVHVNRTVGGEAVPDKRIFCIMRMDGYSPHSPPAGRPGTAITLRQALLRATGVPNGRIPTDVGITPPASVRDWMQSL